MPTKRLFAIVKSSSKPFPDQKDRSSGYFGTVLSDEEYNKLEWEITGTKNPEKITFNVMRDPPVVIGPMVYKNLVNGSVSAMQQYHRLFIADPRGADSDFYVSIYAVK